MQSMVAILQLSSQLLNTTIIVFSKRRKLHNGELRHFYSSSGIFVSHSHFKEFLMA